LFIALDWFFHLCVTCCLAGIGEATARFNLNTRLVGIEQGIYVSVLQVDKSVVLPKVVNQRL